MADIVTSKIFVDGEKGITATKLNQIISGAVIQPAFYSAKPASSTLDPTDLLLELKGTGAYATITGQQLIDSVSSSVSSVRPRSYNSIGNPTFEVDQRTVGAGTSTGGAFALDRWVKGGSLSFSANQAGGGGGLVVPGTNFRISQSMLRITLTAQKASLAATDLMQVYQTVEGPRLRELINDVHSISILCRSSIANVGFSLFLRDSASAYTLTKLCTTSATPNTWTLITLPNIPVWIASGTFPLTPGSAGYTFGVCLASGSTFISPANDTWQSASFSGALGMGNFAANAVNSTFDIAFCQHEPGALCTTPIDLPFGQNLDGDFGCQRYYTKDYPYNQAPGTINNVGTYMQFLAGVSPYVKIPFKKTMAKIPTIVGYSPPTGTAGTVRDVTANVDRTISSAAAPSDSGFSGFTLSVTNAGNWISQFLYTADTGW